MGQITHPTLGSPMAMVTSQAELVTTIFSNGIGPYGIDKSTYAYPTIEYEHHEIHDGNHYHVRGDTSVATSGGSVCFYMFTQNGSRWTHLVFDIYSNNLVDYKEEINCIASGANLILVYNSNRNSTNIYSGSLIFSPLVITSSGIASATGFIGAVGVNAVQKGIAGAYSRNNEIILKSGTGYIWTFKVGGNDTRLGWDAEWYEHTDEIKQW